MRILVCAVLLTIPGNAQRSVDNNVLSSSQNPRIKIHVDNEFEYLGHFDLSIIAKGEEYPKDLIGKVVARGERFVFASSSREKRLSKLFVVQFEGFLADNNQIYRYRFENATKIGVNKYRNNTWFYNEAKHVAEDSTDEAAETRRFLSRKGYTEEDELMASRFVGLADSTRKNEIIIFYFEGMSQSGHTMVEFDNNAIDSSTVKMIKEELVRRLRKSFQIIEG